jgi:hypothetical protein
VDDGTVRERVGEVEQAIASLEGLPPAPRETALAAFGALVELYGEAWARALDHLERTSPDALPGLAEDELVGHLLMIHGLHPSSVEKRVRQALDDLAATVDADGCRVELLGVDGATARLRLNGGGGVAAPGLSSLVEGAVRSAAPELERVEIELAGAAAAEPPRALVQIQVSRPGRERKERAAEVRA